MWAYDVIKLGHLIYHKPLCQVTHGPTSVTSRYFGNRVSVFLVVLRRYDDDKFQFLVRSLLLHKMKLDCPHDSDY